MSSKTKDIVSYALKVGVNVFVVHFSQVIGHQNMCDWQ